MEGETKARAKNGIPLPPDGFSSAHLFLTPLFPTVFYPPTFCLPPETEPHSSVCTFFYSYVFRFGLQSVLLFAVLWFVWGQFYKSVLFLVLSDFTGYIKYLLLVLLGSAVLDRLSICTLFYSYVYKFELRSVLVFAFLLLI